MKKKIIIQKTTLSAMFIALAFVMPFFTMQIPEIGDMMCPMHIPIMLCGYVCGAPWGLLAGIISPLLRSLIMTMPVMYPTGIAMAFELAVYGFMVGFLHNKLPQKKPFIYVSLISAMVTGRIVWGFARAALFGFDLGRFGFEAFWAGAVLNAIPGIIVQIIVVPVIVMLLQKYFPMNKLK